MFEIRQSKNKMLKESLKIPIFTQRVNILKWGQNCINVNYYSDVRSYLSRFIPPTNRLFVHNLIQASNNETTKALYYRPFLSGKPPMDSVFPITTGQYCGKLLRIMTSSYISYSMVHARDGVVGFARQQTSGWSGCTVFMCRGWDGKTIMKPKQKQHRDRW